MYTVCCCIWRSQQKQETEITLWTDKFASMVIIESLLLPSASGAAYAAIHPCLCTAQWVAWLHFWVVRWDDSEALLLWGWGRYRRAEVEVAVTEKRVGGFHSHFKTERRRTWSKIRKLRQESHKTDSLVGLRRLDQVGLCFYMLGFDQSFRLS